MYLEYHKMRKNTAMLQSQTFFDQKKYTENSEIVKGFFSTIEEDEKNNNKKTILEYIWPNTRHTLQCNLYQIQAMIS